jgi:hypothetical protein
MKKISFEMGSGAAILMGLLLALFYCFGFHEGNHPAKQLLQYQLSLANRCYETTPVQIENPCDYLYMNFVILKNQNEPLDNAVQNYIYWVDNTSTPKGAN